MPVGSNADDYTQQLINLTPPGSAFPTNNASTWFQLLNAFAQTFARVDANIVLLLQEAFPDTTLGLLENWERVAGLPDECSSTSDTIEIRRFNLLTKLTSTGGQSKAYFIEMASKLGYTITITEFSPFRTGISHTGDALCNAGWWFVWQVNAALNTAVYFKASNSTAQEPLAYWSNDRLECFIRRYAPAHTRVQFAYS